MGAEINVIGKRNLHPNKKIDTNSVIIIIGIIEGKINTIGSIINNYGEHEIQCR
jgi:hypothetical protein